jgi:hypothetical protein
MTTSSVHSVASVLLKEVPLAQMHGFVTHMSAEAGGTGCGGGCGSGCSRTVDQEGHVLKPEDLAAAVADKPALLKEVASQASAHLSSLG